MGYPNSGLEKKFKALILILFFTFIFISFMKPISDPDATWHLKTGEYIVQNRTIPHSDPFSFANDKIHFLGRFILSQYWLSQIILFLIYKVSGPFGLILLKATVFTLLLAFLWLLIRDKGFYISLLVTGFSFYMLNSFSGLRPQMFTFLFTALLIFLIEKYRRKNSLRYLYPLPFLMLFWANVHGGYIFGIALISLYLFAETVRVYALNKSEPPAARKSSSKQLRYFFLFSAVSISVSFINPNTYKAFLYAFSTHAQNLFYFVEEYQSPLKIMKINPSPVIYSFWISLPLVILMVIIFLKKRELAPLLLLLFSLVLALTSIRYIPLLAIVATAAFRYVPIISSSKIFLKKGPVIDAAAIIFLGILIFTANPFRYESLFRLNDSAFYPVNATEFLIKNKLSGNIFSSYNKSAFLMFKLFPDSRVYSDSRFMSEERINNTLRIQGEFDSVKEDLENINRLVPKNIGTIEINLGGVEKNTNTGAPILEDNSAGIQNWKDLLDTIGADIIVHEAVNLYSGNIYPLIFKLMREDSWKLIYSDGNVLVFVRDEEKFKKVIAQYDLPKTAVYNEIIRENLHVIGKNVSGYYSSTALALLLKGIADDKTLYLIKKSLSLDSRNIYAHYCNALYGLMTHKGIM
jgi:hypothetical protein